MAQSLLLGDWIKQQLEQFQIEPGDKPINYHTRVWLPIAKHASGPGPSSVNVALTTDDPARVVVEELLNRVERDFTSQLRDEFFRQFPNERFKTIRELRRALCWIQERLTEPKAPTPAAKADGKGGEDKRTARRKLPQNGKGGRPKTEGEKEERDLKRFDDWQIAKTAGIKKKDFCKTPAAIRELDRVIDWVAKRKLRGQL